MRRLLLVSMLLHAPALGASHDHQMFGISVAGLSDIDGDGAPDFAVGDPSHPAAGDWSGRVWIVSGATWRPLHVVSGGREGESLGTTLAAGGDLDGDGAPDLLIGAAADNERARVLAVSGASGEVLYVVDLPAEDKMKVAWYSSVSGPPMAALGEVAEHGSTFAVGVPFGDAGAQDAGTVQVRRGRDGAILFEVHGEASCDRFGTSLTSIGDIDGDGVVDFAAGAMPGLDDGDVIEACRSYRAGYVKLISGRDGKTLCTIRPPEGSRRFGVALGVCAGGEADLAPTLLVTSAFWDFDAPVETQAEDDRKLVVARDPIVRAFSMKGTHLGILRYDLAQLGTLLRANEDREQTTPISFGAVVRHVGDVDGDGRPDVLVTAPMAFDGSAGIYSSATMKFVRALSPNQSRSSHFGVSAAVLGDLDGDGHAEIAIGAATIRARGAFHGVLYVHSAATGAELVRLTRARLDAR